MEAMAVGLPVIANPDGGIAEQVPHPSALPVWTLGQMPTGRTNLVMVGQGFAGA
jgi:glycosyltransferase involved in cell wall biosynthesis